MSSSSGTVLCGVDGSRGARDALDLAQALSARLGLRLVVAHVASDEAGLKESERLLRDVQRAAGLPPGLEGRVASGDPAARLADIAAEEGADLIVVGSPSGRRGLRGRGGLAQEIESATSCPVVIAPRLSRPRSPLRLSRAHAVRGS